MTACKCVYMYTCNQCCEFILTFHAWPNYYWGSTSSLEVASEPTIPEKLRSTICNARIIYDNTIENDAEVVNAHCVCG